MQADFMRVYPMLCFFLFATRLPTLGQAMEKTATCLSSDSAFQFNISQTRSRDAQKKKVYYSFVNFKLTPQVGARAGIYLHGDFENRSRTTNKLYAKGEFRYGLKHGEWRTWNADGILKTVERWKKGVLKKRQSFETTEVMTLPPAEPVKKKRRKRESRGSVEKGEHDVNK